MKIKSMKNLIPSLISIIAGLVLGAIIILISGDNPFTIYYSMLIKPLSNIKNILNVFYTMTPLIVTAMSFLIASNAGMINLGIEGQLLLGSLAGVYVATLFPALPWYIYIPVIMTVSMLIGALWSLIPGYLKIKFGASEIVTCIMLNYIAEFVINFVISSGLFKHSTIDQRTPYILENAHFSSLSEIGMGMGSKAMRGVQLNAMFLIAILLVVLVYILLKKTKWGYKIRGIGININATTANRINSKKIMLTAMALSGAVAGISVTGEVLGTFNGLVEGFSPGYGFSGISVALLGQGHPIGAVFAALFFGVLNQGMVYLGTGTNIPKDFAKILQTVIMIFIVISPYVSQKWAEFSLKISRSRKGEMIND